MPPEHALLGGREGDLDGDHAATRPTISSTILQVSSVISSKIFVESTPSFSRIFTALPPSFLSGPVQHRLRYHVGESRQAP
eukprot:9183377-Heterocapsa_arctica.AAC.1